MHHCFFCLGKYLSDATHPFCSSACYGLWHMLYTIIQKGAHPNPYAN